MPSSDRGIALGEILAAGINWATEDEHRAMVVLGGCGGRACLRKIRSPLTKEDVRGVCSDSKYSVVGVDVPFGWPKQFSDFVQPWSPAGSGGEAVPESDVFRFRKTDLIVRDELRKHPLSISSDRIALSARLWAEIVLKNNLGPHIDTRGLPAASSPTVIEVYPAATLRAFADQVNDKHYKREKDARVCLIKALVRDFKLNVTAKQQARVVGEREKDSDITDALIAALTGLIYGGCFPQWTVRKPQSDAEREAAVKEGWIFFPVKVGAATAKT